MIPDADEFPDFHRYTHQKLLRCITIDNDESLARATADLYDIDYNQFREEHSEEIMFAKLTRRC